jgi:3-oxoacyl-[acyl-carrier-protein] synthase-1
LTVAAPPLAIVNAGLVTSVGLTAPAACAAIRAGLTNHTDTRFTDTTGAWIAGAQVPLDQPWRGREKLARMVTMAIEECLEPFPDLREERLPILLCVAEPQRAGRLDGLDDELLAEICERLSGQVHLESSSVVPYGRVGVAVALSRARALVREPGPAHVLIAAVDSLLVGPTLGPLDSGGRLLSKSNTNGFVPGEAAGAVLLARDPRRGSQLMCLGLGFSEEPVPIASEEPFRADGLTGAIKKGLADAGCEMHDLDFRITDNSGEQYYFKEASLGLTRTMRQVKPEFEIWHPADCVGETGAAIGAVALAVALTACRKAYSAGSNILFHSGSDAGHRAAVILRYTEVA